MPDDQTVPGRTWASAATARLVAVPAVVLLIAGVVVAFFLRDDDGAVLTTPIVLVGVGALLTVVSVALMVWAETRPASVTEPADPALAVQVRAGLPLPSVWGPLFGAGATLALAGAFVSALVAGLGLGLVLAATGLWVAELLQRHRVLRLVGKAGEDGPTVLDRSAVATARRLQGFALRHGGAAGSVVSDVGRYGAKVVLVGSDGRYGEQTVSTHARALLACELAGVPLEPEWTRDLSATLRSDKSQWERMGGQQLTPAASGAPGQA